MAKIDEGAVEERRRCVNRIKNGLVDDIKKATHRLGNIPIGITIGYNGNCFINTISLINTVYEEARVNVLLYKRHDIQQQVYEINDFGTDALMQIIDRIMEYENALGYRVPKGGVNTFL